MKTLPDSRPGNKTPHEIAGPDSPWPVARAAHTALTCALADAYQAGHADANELDRYGNGDPPRPETYSIKFNHVGSNGYHCARCGERCGVEVGPQVYIGDSLSNMLCERCAWDLAPFLADMVQTLFAARWTSFKAQTRWERRFPARAREVAELREQREQREQAFDADEIPF